MVGGRVLVGWCGGGDEGVLVVVVVVVIEGEVVVVVRFVEEGGEDGPDFVVYATGPKRFSQ